MKQIILLLILLSALIPGCSAGSDLIDPVGVGAEMVAKGGDIFIVRMADSLMDFASGKNETEGNTTIKESRPSVTDMIISFSTWSVTPFQYPTVIKIMGLSLCGGAVFLLIYTFIGAGYAATNNLQSKKYETLKFLMNSDGGNRAVSNYAKNVIAGCIAVTVIVLFIAMSLLLASVLKSMIMESIADSISPSMTSVPVLYLAMSMMWACESVFFGLSNLVICMTASICLFLGALYASDRTRHITIGWMDYFFGMVMMQVSVVVTVAIVVGVIMDIKNSGGYLSPNMEMSLYIALIFFVVGGCLLAVVGKVRLFKTAKTVIKMVT